MQQLSLTGYSQLVSCCKDWNFPHKWTSRKYGISCWLHKFWIYSFIQFIVRPPALTEKRTKWENKNKNEKYDIEYENKKDWSFQPRLSFGWEAQISDSNTITVHYHKQTKNTNSQGHLSSGWHVPMLKLTPFSRRGSPNGSRWVISGKITYIISQMHITFSVAQTFSLFQIIWVLHQTSRFSDPWNLDLHSLVHSLPTTLITNNYQRKLNKGFPTFAKAT